MSFPPLNAKRKRRLALALLIVLGVGTSVSLALVALQENINLFYNPSQVFAGEAPVDHSFRIGGMVVTDSVRRENNSLKVRFILTDTAKDIPIEYTGILPDLFREGQGIIAQGRLQNGVFVAEEVLAKHDENYMPPEIAQAIEAAKAQKQLSGKHKP